MRCPGINVTEMVAPPAVDYYSLSEFFVLLREPIACKNKQ